MKFGVISRDNIKMIGFSSLIVISIISIIYMFASHFTPLEPFEDAIDNVFEKFGASNVKKKKK